MVMIMAWKTYKQAYEVCEDKLNLLIFKREFLLRNKN